MKKCLFSLQILVITSVVYWGTPSYGQDVYEQTQDRDKDKEEAALLGKLKGYIQDNDIHANGVPYSMQGQLPKVMG